jgi:hypothetical protein
LRPLLDDIPAQIRRTPTSAFDKQAVVNLVYAGFYLFVPMEASFSVWTKTSRQATARG